ncbi:SLC13 family permease [Massilia sp. DWR3-1-1]|uniref:SLC13 family permease n=1 Tax=Massilia sp. DWR3-1-1 TaxID=2804559 RepID=UPI003CFB1ECC
MTSPPASHPALPGLPALAWQALRADRLLHLLLAALLALTLCGPTPVRAYGALVDWPTIAALTGLLALTQGLELSGVLAWLGRRLVAVMATERRAALLLVASALLLSTVLTNDVALFVVVPLTLGMCKLTGMPAARLVVFEALAVNAGSALTPIGNPQNLFLWQLSQVSFGQFVLHMLPLAALLSLILLALTALTFGARPIALARQVPHGKLDHRLLWVALTLYLPFLVATDLHQAGWALLVVLASMAMLRPAVLARLDWGLLLVFVLMFIDLRLVAGLPQVQAAMAQLGLDRPEHLYFAGIGASQVISNVPAAIALAAYSQDWKVLAYAVSVGGFGTAVGSLASLIALRMVGEARAWALFHCYALPFLALATGIGYALLFRA